ncbi:MAG: ROK family glucokinase [Lachnospiraceae bacterium]|nr:ROK family glucokinase [Lachnospiraceae bacterium]
MKTCIGIDVGGTTVKLGIFTEDGTLLEKWEIPTRIENGGKNILPDIADAVLEKLREKDIPAEEILGAGIGVPGAMMPDGQVAMCVNLGWRDLNPARELEKLLKGIPVKGGNDANVAALGEYWQGGGKGYNSVAMATLGTGVGCGIILNGEVMVGSKGMGGELGHFPVNRQETERCNCGGYGCLELYSSATGLVRLAKRHMAASDEASVLREKDTLTAKDVLDAAKAGDCLADSVVDEAMDYLALGLTYVSYTVDPEVYVIGGGVSKAGEFLLDKIRKHYEGYVKPREKAAKITLATLGNDAGIYGAAKLVLNNR